MQRGGSFAWGIVPTTIPGREQKMFNYETPHTLKVKIYQFISLMGNRKIYPGNSGSKFAIDPILRDEEFKLSGSRKNPGIIITL